MTSRLGFRKFSIQLANGYNFWHALVYLFAAAITISLFVFLNSTQGFVLGEIFNIPSNRLGEYSGNLVFYDEIAAILTVSIWGILSDIIGRFRVYSMGFVLTALALLFFVQASTYSPDLILLRVVFAVGGSACSCMLSACLADISSESDRGKFSGLLGFCSGLGAILGVSVFLPLPARLGGGTDGLKTAFGIIATLSLATAVLLLVFSFFMPKNVEIEEVVLVENSENDSTSNIERNDGNNSLNSSEPLFVLSTTESKPFLSQLCQSAKTGVLQAKNPEILLGYLASFLARSDSISITLYLPLWIYKYYIEQGFCYDIPGDEKNSCNDAYIKASIFSGVAQVFALIGAPVFGILLDRINRSVVVYLASTIAAIGYILLGFSSPIASINFLYLFLIGFGEIGLIVSSVALVTQNSIPRHARGAVSGISSFMGALGILVSSKVGGILFDWFSGAPFLFLGLLHVIFLLCFGLSYLFLKII
jgi:MFS family permease